MPCAVIFKNPRTPFYDIVITSKNVDDIPELIKYIMLYCPVEDTIWNSEEYNKLGECWITEYSVIIEKEESLNKFGNRGVAMCIYMYMMEERVNKIGTVEYGIKYFSKYAFSNHYKLSNLSILDKERIINHTESMTPIQLLIYYIDIINKRKSRTKPLHINIENTENVEELFCLSPISSPINQS
jgi:hypothetical protein